jgi:hypothetical protein
MRPKSFLSSDLKFFICQKIILVFCCPFAILFSAQKSFSFVSFEPMAGYQFQNLKLVDLTNSSQEFKTDGTVFGAKLGLRTPIGISLDLVGTYSNGTAKSTPSLTQNPDFTQLVGSLQLGVSAMNIMKLYLGSIFSSEYQIKANSFTSGMKLSGVGYQAGIILFISKNWAFTVNYNLHQFKKVAGETYNAGDDIKTYFTTHDLSDLSTFISYTF